MEKNVVECPKCGENFSLADVVAVEFEQRIRHKIEKQLGRRELEIQAKQKAVEAEENQLDAERKKLTQTIQLELQRERAVVERKIRDDVEKNNLVTIKDLRNQISERDDKLNTSVSNELELRRKMRELEEGDKERQLLFQRKLDEDRKAIAEQLSRQISEEYRFKVAEKDKVIDEMKRHIDELKRKGEQGSQQTQGEVLELELENLLKAWFPSDAIEPVAKGVKGADVLQQVVSPSGRVSGSILWETKRRKLWNDQWIEKLKEDQREAGAECAVIVTQVLPKDVSNFGYRDGVWVTNIATLLGLSTALRQTLIQVFTARNVSICQGEKMELMFTYLTGTQFRHRVEAIVEAFRGMQLDLEKEKRGMQRLWATREQQLSKVISSTVAMYGDVQGLLGQSLPTIPSLDLDSPSLPLPN